MKTSLVGALLAINLSVGVSAQDRTDAQWIFSGQINERAAGLVAVVVDGKGEYKISKISSEGCVTTVISDKKSWVIDWVFSDGIEVVDPSMFILYGAGRPNFAITADETDKKQVGILTSIAQSMEHLWNNCGK